MNPSEVIVHEIEGERVPVILDLLGMGIRQSRKPLHIHPYLSVHPLRKACREIFAVRIAGNPMGVSLAASCWAITSCYNFNEAVE